MALPLIDALESGDHIYQQFPRLLTQCCLGQRCGRHWYASFRDSLALDARKAAPIGYLSQRQSQTIHHWLETLDRAQDLDGQNPFAADLYRLLVRCVLDLPKRR